MNNHSPDLLKSARRAVLARRFQEAVDELGQLRDALGTSPEWLLLSSMATWRLGSFGESLDSAARALEGYRLRGDVDGEMRSLNVGAAGHFADGRLAEAEVGFDRALRLARQLDDRLMMARCANNLGNVEFYRSMFPASLALYKQATSLFEQVGSLHGVAEAYHNQGVVLREMEELEAARAATERALETAQILGDARAIGWTLGAQGETDALRGDLRLGRVELERSLELARASGDRLTEIDSLRVLATVARADGRPDDALALCEDAVALARNGGSTWALARAENELGESLVGLGRQDEAKQAFVAAATAFEAMGAETRARMARARAEEQ